MKRMYTEKDHIVYKKAYNKGVGVVVVMRIVKGTEVNFPVSRRERKNRTVRVRVLEIRDRKNNKRPLKKAVSGWNWRSPFVYTVGKVITEGDKLYRPGVICERGIHFFSDFKSAARW